LQHGSYIRNENTSFRIVKLRIYFSTVYDTVPVITARIFFPKNGKILLASTNMLKPRLLGTD